MTDIIRDETTQWRQLCQIAYFELEPVTLLQRVGEARSAVLDRIEDVFPGQSHSNRTNCATP